MPWELLKVYLLTFTFKRSPKTWNFISWMCSIDLLMIIRWGLFCIWIKMSPWAAGRHPLDCLVAAKERTCLWPDSLLLPAGVPGWTLDLARPLSVAGAAHGLRYQPQLCPPCPAPGGWSPWVRAWPMPGSPPVLACPPCRSSCWCLTDTRKTSSTVAVHWLHQYSRLTVCLGVHPCQCR